MLFFRIWRGNSEHLKDSRRTSTAAYYGICDMIQHCSSTLLHQSLARWIDITGINASDGSAMTFGYGVEVTTERSFEDLMVSEGQILSFNEALLTGVCSSLEIPRSCATVLCHQRGSVVATVILFAEDPGTSSTPSGEQVRVRAFLVLLVQRLVHGSPERKRKVVLHTRIYAFMCACLGLFFLCGQGEQAGAKLHLEQRPRSARVLAKQLSACVRMFGNTSIFSAEGLGWSSVKVVEVGPVTRPVVDAVLASICEQRQLLNLDGKGKVLSVSLSRSNKLVHTMAARRSTSIKVTCLHAWQDGIFARTVKHVTKERRSRIRSHRVLNDVWHCMRAKAVCVRALRKKEECIKWRLRAHSQSMVLEEMYRSMLERRRLRARARQVVAKSARQSLLHAICRWKQSCARSRALLQNLLRTKRRGMHRLLARALSTWTRRVESSTSALRKKIRQQRHMSKLEQLCVATVLYAWFQMCQAARRHATSIQRLVFRQLRHRLSTVVVVWQQQARATVLKVKLAWRRSSLAVACCCRMWSAHTAHVRSSQSTVCAARKRSAVRWFRQALCAWKENAHWGVHTRTMTSRICSRANCASVRATVETWWRYTKRRKMLASKLTTLRVRLNVWRVHAQLATWRRHATHVVCARRLFAHRCGRSERMQRRFRQRSAEHKFAAWQLWTASQARMRRKLVALTRRRELTRSLVSMRISLDTWKQAAATVVFPSLPPLPFSWLRPCLIVSRSLFALHVSCSSTPADLLSCTWARNPPLRPLLSLIFAVAAQIQRAFQAQHSANAIKSIRLRVGNRHLRRLLKAWQMNVEATLTHKLRRTQLESVSATLWSYFALTSAFSILLAHWRNQRRARSAALALQGRLHLRIVHQQLFWCFGTWTATAADAATHRERSAAQRSVDECYKELETCRRDLSENNASMRQLEHDLEVRTSELAEKTLQKTVLEAKNKNHCISRQHLASRLLCMDKIRVLSSWHKLVLRIKNSFHKANKRRLLLRCKLAAASFHSWAVAVHTHALLRARCVRYQQYSLHSRMVAMLCGWQRVSAYNARLVRADRRRELERSNDVIARAFWHWLETHRAQKVHTQRHMHLLARLCTTMQAHQTKEALISIIEHWCFEACSQRLTQRHSSASARTAARLQARLLAARTRVKLLLWHRLMLRRRWLESRTSAAMRCSVRRTCLKMLCVWYHAALLQRAFQRRGQKATARLQQQQAASVGRALKDWLCAVSARRRRRVRQARGDQLRGASLRTALARMMMTWSQRAYAKLWLRGPALHMQRLLTRHIHVRIFAKWRNFHSLTRRTRVKENAFCFRRGRVVVAARFTLWRHVFHCCLGLREIAWYVRARAVADGLCVTVLALPSPFSRSALFSRTARHKTLARAFLP
jgi:hypothetical protein